MKKVLFMIDSLNGGGAERVLINILKRMDYTKYQVTVFLIFGEGVYLSSVPQNVKVRSLLKGYNTIKGWHPILRMIYKIYIKLTLGIVKILKGRPIYNHILKEKYDVEISFIEGDTCYFVANSRNKASKKISWIHIDLGKRRTMDYTTELRSLSRMDKIICVSNGTKKSVLSLYPQLEDKLQVIYNPIDKEQIIMNASVPIQISKDKTTIVCVGRLVYQKGYNVLLQAHKELINEGIEHQVIVLGEGNLENELKKQILELNLQESFTLLGYRENPYPYIKAADIYVLPSIFEGFSLSLVEAMVLGKPCIATRCVGPTEILNDEYGLLVEPGEMESLKQSMKKLIENKELQEYYSKKSLERIAIFDIDSVMKEISNIIE